MSQSGKEESLFPGEYFVMKKTLIITGIKEELEFFFARNPHTFNREIRCYQLEKYPDVFCMTGGPGIRRKKEVRKVIREIKPDIVISAGLVGLANRRLMTKRGEKVKIAGIVDKSEILFGQTEENGYFLTSVPYPVFSPSEKEDLYEETGADFCDMETLPLIQLLEESGLKPLLCTIKILGDRPEDFDLYRYEKEFREINLRRWQDVLHGMIRFSGGIFRFYMLLYRKQRQYRKLARSMEQSIKEISVSGKPYEKNCFFIH